jgi:phage I-like protein
MTATAAIPCAPADLLPPTAREPAVVPEWVMLARTGAWLGHPAVPEVVSAARLSSARDHFERHCAAHGVDLVVDYHHASVYAGRQGTRAPAAGWVREMALRENGTQLWGRVLWTAEAASAIARREFRYVSPVLQFDVPDRLTGEPVPMVVHSLALTNTPFMTELEGLNQSAATDGGGPLKEGGETMSVLDSLAAALEQEPAEVARRLGLPPDADERSVAGLLLGNAAQARAATEALELPADAAPTDLRAALIRLKAPGAAGLPALRAKLGLSVDAPESQVLNAVDALQQSAQQSAAEALIDDAVRAGRIPPAHRDFYLREALGDLDAARQVINSLSVVTGPSPDRPAIQPAHGGRSLTDAESRVCRQLGLTEEAFLAAAQ